MTDYLAEAGLTRIAFSREAGVSPSIITHLCNDEQPWVTRRLALRIRAATAGKWSPDDLLPPYEPPAAQGPAS